MIIQKVTLGIVIQQYDTMTDSWVMQQFVPNSATVEYMNEKAERVDPAIMGDPEPYLPFDMIQPPVVK